jgi:hypothetical protein
VNPNLTYLSALHPYSTKSEVPVVIRFIVTPVYLFQNQEEDIPDGFLVYGDILNGKVGLNDQVLDAYEDGYAGTFYYNKSTNAVHTLSSVARSVGDSRYVYEPQLSDDVQRIVKKAYEHRHQIKGTALIDGKEAEIAVSRVDLSFSVDCSLNSNPLSQYYPTVYMVRGNWLNRWKALENSQFSIGLSCVFIQTTAMVIMAVMLFRPVHKFIAHMKGSIVVSGDAKKKKPMVANITSKFKTRTSVGGGDTNNNSSRKDSTHVDA